MAVCRKCKKEIGGFFGAKKALPVTIENAVKRGIDPNSLCDDCLQYEVDNTRDPFVTDEEHERTNALQGMVISTANHPAEWTKDIVGVVNGFSIIGTGILSDFFSTFTDFFGAESRSYHDKLVRAKNNAILRAKEEALTMGANMIFGLQVNITEISTGHGMLLVAVTGTALKREEM